MTLSEAQHRSNYLVEQLTPLCKRVEIVGSVRRLKPDPKDIELIAIPDLTDTAKFNALRELVNVRLGRVDIGAFPSRYTRVVHRGCYSLDLFWQSRETYGLNKWIRTGPAEYAMRGLAFWKKVTNGGYSEGAKLFLPDGTLVPTLEEDDVFAAFDKYSGPTGPRVNFIAPERRR